MGPLFILLCLTLMAKQQWAAQENVVACKLPDSTTFDADGMEVDWFVLYKLPKTPRYAYISAQNHGEMQGRNIGNNESPVKLTLDSFFNLEETRPLRPTLGKKDIYRDQLLYIFYGYDQVESLQDARYSKSRGVLIVQPAISNMILGGGAGIAHPDGAFWMTHTVPSFPAANTSAWNPQHNRQGHLFLCLSMETSQLSSLTETLFHEQPFVYHSNYPKYAFESGSLVGRCAKVSEMEFLLHPVFIGSAELTTYDGMSFSVISANYKLAADIASTWIAVKFQMPFYSWNRRNSTDVVPIRDCFGKFQVENLIGQITVAGTAIGHSEDSSRWLVSPQGIWCILSSHRPNFLEKVSGGAICIRNPHIVHWFTKAMQSASIQHC
uniref:Deoxyribonuclease II n=1 Tax=Trichuris muris TaxID=70415 RepID=A0A5S6QER6_TRIMR